MSEKELSQKESLELITQMIRQAKSNYSKGGSFYFLLWGWVVMLANFGQYMLYVYFDSPYHYMVWLVTIPAVIVTIIYGIRESKNAPVVSHLDRMYGHLWWAVGFGIVITLVHMTHLSYNHNAVILTLAAIGTYISGQMLKFKPLMLGGVALGIASIVAFNVAVMDQTLVGGIGVLLGYLVPGYLLKRKEK